MQKFLQKFSFVAIALTLLIATGCGEDEDPIFVDDLPPSIALNSGAGLITSNAELLPGETFSVSLSLATGDNPLQSFTFLVDGVAPNNTEIANYYSEFAINGSTEVANNPITLFGAAKDGSTIDITITPYQQMPGEIRTYTFEVEDEVKEIATISIDITVLDDPNTPLDATLTGVLFNQAGPAGTGGLDLDTGDGTGSSATESELRDLGLDCTVPAPGFNWRRQIGTINGAVMRKVDVDEVENFTFANVDNKEQIEAAHDTGIELSDGTSVSCATGTQTAVTDVTDELVVGDMFTVTRGDRTYLIRIDEINETNDNNADNYVISIKY